MKEEGFTLIEVIVAITITGIIFGTIFTVFEVSFSTWQRAEGSSELNQQWRILNNQLRKDLRRLYISDLYRKSKFAGDYQQFSWLIKGEEGFNEVIYSFSANQITREVKKGADGEGEVVKEMTFFVDLELDISQIKRRFYNSEYSYWQRNWSYQKSGELPEAVKLELDSQEIDLPQIVIDLQVGQRY
jgi:general secretion pathway protein J